MAQKNVNNGSSIVERNISLTERIMRFLIDKPEFFSKLPNDFELVILPDDDPEIRQYNLELIDKYGCEGRPIVFARLKAHPVRTGDRGEPSLFVPVHLAA